MGSDAKLPIEFPSPYRGYHLSTSWEVWRRCRLCFWFPSPYRGYHLSTLEVKRHKYRCKKRFRPLIGVIIFQQFHIQYYSINIINVSVPLSGLSSFNDTDNVDRKLWELIGFRPLIGVIIFQLRRCMHIWVEHSGFPSPYRGYHLSTWETQLTIWRRRRLVSVPLSGLSSFNVIINKFSLKEDSFRPLIGVIIFQLNVVNHILIILH